MLSKTNCHFEFRPKSAMLALQLIENASCMDIKTIIVRFAIND